jgi:uncharacterized protein (DUF2141 family)
LKPTIIIAAVLLFCSSFSTKQNSLQIQVTGARNIKGHVLVSLFNSSDGFPDKDSKAIKKLQLKVSGNTATGSFGAMPAGDYAVAILHDENNDLKMNTNWVGLPKEGFGFSNNAMGMFGPPSFSKAKVVYGGGAYTLQVKLKYF